MKKKVIDYTQLTVASTIVAFVIALICKFLGYGTDENVLAVTVATFTTALIIIGVRENKFTKSEIDNPGVWYLICILLAIMFMVAFIDGEYFRNSFGPHGANIATILIVALSFLVGLSNAGYSIAVNLTAVCLAVYYGAFNTTDYFLFMGILSVVTIVSVVVKFIFGTKWSKMGKKQVNSF